MRAPRSSFPPFRDLLAGTALWLLLPGCASFGTSMPTPHSSTPSLAAASGDEKQKVPKPVSPPAPRTKPDSKKESSGSEDSYDDGDSGGPTDCLFGFMAMAESPTPPPPLTPATAFASEAVRWQVGSSAWLVAPAAVDSVELLDAPAEPDQPGTTVGSLPHGAHVVVIETHSLTTGFWTLVRPFDGVEPHGWVPSWVLAEDEAPAPAPVRVMRPDPRWGIRVVAGWSKVGPSDLDVEYRDGGFRADLQYMRILMKQWISGFGFGFRTFEGRPKTAYLLGVTLDDPQHSRLQTFEIGMRAGQRYGDRSGLRSDWLIGPTLAFVRETAKLDVYTVREPDTLVFVESRQDALGRWVGGAEVRGNIGGTSASGIEWGLHLGAFMYAWEGQREHSLVTDFVRSNIHGWDIGLSFSFFR